jgi:hypothetical protein
MLSNLLEFGGVVYLVAMGSLVAGLLRSAKTGSQLTDGTQDQPHQAKDDVCENLPQANPQAEA